ncbi:hypothetical protein [Tenacibaculum agarivorans]|uniref:hypothetical protein n=1 Tax=Tenacibaculum agarivorans TaxID=1908389 RepID=UPI00094BBA20|nr:hypothetical protein [Tenacibaculum agarivorans]
MNSKTYNLLKRMQKRPMLWTGQNTLKSIASFLFGYQIAMKDHNFEDDFGISLDFFDWVADKLGYNYATAGWANMILANIMGFDPQNIEWENYDISVTNTQHSESIVKFYALIDEYMDELKTK